MRTVVAATVIIQSPLRDYYGTAHTDASRFPDWPIGDPVGLLRSVLDAWRLELEKATQQEAVLSNDDAYNILGIPPASDATVSD